MARVCRPYFSPNFIIYLRSLNEHFSPAFLTRILTYATNSDYPSYTATMLPSLSLSLSLSLSAQQAFYNVPISDQYGFDYRGNIELEYLGNISFANRMLYSYDIVSNIGPIFDRHKTNILYKGGPRSNLVRYEGTKLQLRFFALTLSITAKKMF